MRILKIITKSIAFLLVFIFLSLIAYATCTGKWFIFKALRYNFINIDDYKIFNNRTIARASTPFLWKTSTSYNQHIFSDSLQKLHIELKSVAFLVIQNDSILVEKYWNEYDAQSVSNSFSMAKSVVSLLIGTAIKDGLIQSVDQKVADFIPEFSKGEKSKITIKHLLMMSSGLDWDESRGYNRSPVSAFFSDIMEAYYGNDVNKLAVNKLSIEKPGIYFDYKSGDTQLLAVIIEKASGMSLSAYFEKNIWQVIGAEQDALWNLDEKGNEKAFCCLNSNARDFAKLGKIMLQNGFINGKQVIDSSYYKAMTSPILLKDKEDTTQIVENYGYQTWIINNFKGNKVIIFRGTLGQIIISIPQKNMIIVRLGEGQGNKKHGHYAQIYKYLEEFVN
jgi:CubicO group peptidase (beta-lactamase class C family)